MNFFIIVIQEFEIIVECLQAIMSINESSLIENNDYKI